MIVPMKKVSFVVLNAEKKEALINLRKVGVVHLETLEGSGQNLANLKEAYSDLQVSRMMLEDIKLDKKQSKALKQIEVSKDESVIKAREILDLNSKIKNLTDEITALSKEYERLQAWQGFNPKDFDYLAEKGIYLLPYEVSKDVYFKKMNESIDRIYVNSDKSKVRFLVVSKDGSKPEEMVPEALAVQMSEISTDEMQKQISNNHAQIAECKKGITEHIVYLESIKNAMKIYEKDIEFENAYTGMYTDGENGEEAKLAWLTGYVPSEDLGKVKDAAKQNNWGFLADDPDNPDEVPTKLKNNKLVSLIYPVTDFLGTVPGYAEFDISAWFLLFFCIFFGMIFGDGGYGLLLTILGLFLIFKGASKKRVGSAPVLVLLLGLFTTLWGVLTCNWFGIKPDSLPQAIQPFLKKISWNWISNCSTLQENLVTQNLQIFCFSLALIQLSVAHIKAIIKNIKSLKFLGDLGKLAMLWGMFYAVLWMVVDKVRFPLDLDIALIPERIGFACSFAECGVPVSKIVLSLIGGGFALSFIFSSYEGKIGKSILESCKNIISVLLGVVNVFSDIVSYIRLWAVGLAGAAIANTVNEMAGPMLGNFLIFAGIILLVFGHGLNMILNVLSVIVHGVRLNTLEFSSHLDMSWSGFSYKPFADK